MMRCLIVALCLMFPITALAGSEDEARAEKERVIREEQAKANRDAKEKQALEEQLGNRKQPVKPPPDPSTFKGKKERGDLPQVQPDTSDPGTAAEQEQRNRYKKQPKEPKGDPGTAADQEQINRFRKTK